MNRKTLSMFDNSHLKTLAAWLQSLADEAAEKAATNSKNPRWHRAMAAYWNEQAGILEIELKRRFLDALEISDILREADAQEGEAQQEGEE